MQNMRDLLRGTLRQSLRAMPPLDRLAAAWPVACGRAMAEHGQVASFADGAVVVQVTHSAWLTQMMSMRSLLQHDLARISGVTLTGIHFHLEQNARNPPPARARSGDKKHHE